MSSALAERPILVVNITQMQHNDLVQVWNASRTTDARSVPK
jgi:hypothetical protein